MDDITIRKAKPGDEVKVLELVEEVLSPYGLELNPEMEDLDITDISKYYTQNNGDFEVIEFKGNIVGSYGIYKVDEDTCELRKMYLKQNFQGLGLGNIMIENSFKLAKALNYKKITLQTNSVLYKAIKLYKKYGFEEFDDNVCQRCDIAMIKYIDYDNYLNITEKRFFMRYFDTSIENLKIRETNKEDCGLILSLIKEIAEYEKMSNEVIATEETLLESLFNNNRAEVVILELDEKPVGYALFFYNFSTFIGKSGLYLEDVFIKKEARGRGIGKEVFKFLGKKAREEGCKRIEWTCLDWNEPSIKFYKSLGAMPMDEWTTYRLNEKEIIKLSEM